MSGATSRHEIRIKNHHVAIAVAVVLTLTSAAWGTLVLKQSREIAALWDTELKRTELVGETLSDIHDAIGYGGYIHQFKNYIIRQDEALLARMDETYTVLLGLIDSLESNTRDINSFEEIFALRSVIDTYRENADLAQELFSEGASIVEVDSAVRIDDADALKALAIIETQSVQFRTDAVQRAQDRSEQLLRIILFGGALLVLQFLGGLYVSRQLQNLHRLSEDMRAQADETAAVMDGSLAAILSINAKGMIERTNTAATAISGYTAFELKNMRFDRLVPAELRDRHADLEQQFLSQPEVRSMLQGRTVELETKMGDRFPVHISLTPTRIGGGELRVIVSILRTISTAREKGANNVVRIDH